MKDIATENRMRNILLELVIADKHRERVYLDFVAARERHDRCVDSSIALREKACADIPHGTYLIDGEIVRVSKYGVHIEKLTADYDH